MGNDGTIGVAGEIRFGSRMVRSCPGGDEDEAESMSVGPGGTSTNTFAHTLEHSHAIVVVSRVLYSIRPTSSKHDAHTKAPSDRDLCLLNGNATSAATQIATDIHRYVHTRIVLADDDRVDRIVVRCVLERGVCCHQV